MPELPEIETVRAGLDKLLPGREVRSVDFDWPKSFPNAKADVEQYLINAKPVLVRRRAKVLIIELSTNYSLVVHLKMTGQLVFRSDVQQFGAGHPNESLVGKLPDRSTRVTITFRDDSQLFFNDQRKFGWMRLMPTVEIENLDFFKKVGPEPLSVEFDWKQLKERMLGRKNSNVKSVLLDQTVVAGIGNIYADECLWGAMIHPGSRVATLTDRNFKELYEDIVMILELSIEKGGSTDKNYVDAEGKRGSYLSFARVFRLEGEPCKRCGTEIVKTRVAARGTHFCPKCQKITL